MDRVGTADRPRPPARPRGAVAPELVLVTAALPATRRGTVTAAEEEGLVAEEEEASVAARGAAAAAAAEAVAEDVRGQIADAADSDSDASDEEDTVGAMEARPSSPLYRS